MPDETKPQVRPQRKPQVRVRATPPAKPTYEEKLAEIRKAEEIVETEVRHKIREMLVDDLERQRTGAKEPYQQIVDMQRELIKKVGDEDLYTTWTQQEKRALGIRS